MSEIFSFQHNCAQLIATAAESKSRNIRNVHLLKTIIILSQANTEYCRIASLTR